MMSDLMSSFDLAMYAEIGLVIFLVVFVAVVVKVFVTPSKTIQHDANLPLVDDAPSPHEHNATSRGAS